MSEIFAKKKESKSLEYKKEVPKKDQILKTCIAFANGSGGTLILGIEDKTRRLCGVEGDPEVLVDQLRQSLFDAVEPPPLFWIFPKLVQGRNLIIIKVFPGKEVPYFLRKLGIQGGTFVRNGSSTRLASAARIAELKSSFQGNGEVRVSEATFKFIDKNSVFPNLTSAELKKVLFELGALVGNQRDSSSARLTNAALLFFCSNPQKFLPEGFISLNFFGATGQLLESEDINGSIPKMVETCLEKISNFLKKGFLIQKNGVREKKIPFSNFALRELIVNALVHRDYLIESSVKVFVFIDRIEIVSPGELVSPLQIDSLGRGISVLRNPKISFFSRKAGVSEKLGLGISVVRAECKKMNAKPPIFLEKNGFFKAVLFFRNSFEKKSKPEYKTDEFKWELLFEKNEFSIRDVMQTFGISRNTATRKVNILIFDKKLKRVGKGSLTRFLVLKKTKAH